MSDVEIYIVDLSQVSLRLSISKLSREDLTKAADMINTEVQQRFIKSRAILVNILTDRLLSSGVSGDTLEFNCNVNGKPYLKNHADLHFNTSHSGKYLLIALAGFPVGIDIEQQENSDLLSETARVVFSDEECQQLNFENAGGFLGKFYNFWTRKEAYIKALGCGFSCDPKLISIHDLAGEVKDDRLDNSAFTQKMNGRWHVHNLNIFEGFAAALAVPHSDASFTMTEYVPCPH